MTIWLQRFGMQQRFEWDEMGEIPDGRGEGVCRTDDSGKLMLMESEIEVEWHGTFFAKIGSVVDRNKNRFSN